MSSHRNSHLMKPLSLLVISSDDSDLHEGVMTGCECVSYVSSKRQFNGILSWSFVSIKASCCLWSFKILSALHSFTFLWPLTIKLYASFFFLFLALLSLHFSFVSLHPQFLLPCLSSLSSSVEFFLTFSHISFAIHKWSLNERIYEPKVSIFRMTSLIFLLSPLLSFSFFVQIFSSVAVRNVYADTAAIFKLAIMQHSNVCVCVCVCVLWTSHLALWTWTDCILHVCFLDSVPVCVCVCVSVCVLVWERERGKGREKECVCVHVWKREKERERERQCVCV